MPTAHTSAAEFTVPNLPHHRSSANPELQTRPACMQQAGAFALIITTNIEPQTPQTPDPRLPTKNRTFAPLQGTSL